MSVPPQLMQQMMGRGGAPGAPPSPAAGAGAPGGGGGTPPAAAPMSSPQNKAGQQTEAMAQVEIALTMLQQAVGKLTPGSPERREVEKIMHSLGRLTAKRDTSDLVPAQVMQMVRGMPQMGGGSQIQQALMRQMAMQRMQAMRGAQQTGTPGAAGAAPGGASPGMLGGA